jgi:predicted MFS family arabinose efflux permease
MGNKNQVGSLSACLAILVSALFLFYKYVLQISPSVMTRELMMGFHIQAAGLGNLASMFFYSYLVVQFFVGFLLDRYGPRYLSTAAILIAALGAYLFSVADALWVAYFSRILMGVGAAFATVSYLKIATIYFHPRHFALVAGFLASAAMMGAMMGQAPLALLVQAVGWQAAILFCSIFGVLLGLAFFLLVRRRAPYLQSMDKPQDSLTLRDVLAVFMRPQNWLLTLYSGFVFSPVAVFCGLWGNPFLEEAAHLTRLQAAGMIEFVFLGLALGAPLIGYWASHCRSAKPFMYWGCLCSLLSISLVIYVPGLSWGVMRAALFCFGLGTASYMLCFSIGKDNNPIVVAATVVALINTGDAFVGAYTEPLVGYFLDHAWAGKIVDGVRYFTVENYRHAFLIIPLYLLISLGCLRLIREQDTSAS